jgi:AraC family ethanolamine operon transcriptional activator
LNKTTSKTRNAISQASASEADGMPPVIQGRFSDFDEFTEATAAWEIDFRQVGNGALNADLFQVLDEHTSLAWARFSHCCWQQGLADPGMRTFAVLHPAAPETRFCGQSFEAGNIALFGTDEFECISPPGFDVVTISVRQEDLDSLGEANGLAGNIEKLGFQPEVMVARPEQLQKLRLGVLSALRSIRNSKDPLSVRTANTLLKTDIPNLLLETLGGIDQRERRLASVRRHALLRRARAYIHDRLHESVRVLDVARELGTSSRTLELTFRELLDITPKEYINTSRLYAFHRNLRSAEPGKKVSDIANDMGYWHMGELARNYRLRFGELPSVTLNSA